MTVEQKLLGGLILVVVCLVIGIVVRWLASVRKLNRRAEESPHLGTSGSATQACPATIKVMGRYLDHRMSVFEREEFVGHIRSCPACHSKLNSLEALQTSALLGIVVRSKCYKAIMAMGRCLDPKLTAESREEFLGHIESCAACRDKFSRFEILLRNALNGVVIPMTGREATGNRSS